MEMNHEYRNGAKPGALIVTPSTSAAIHPVVSTAEKEKPFNMPTELWGKVFVLLDLEDNKSIRLAWRRWANIAARFLFRTFVFRVDRQDLGRFDVVSQNESILAGISSLCFELGTMGIGCMARALGSEYRKEYNKARSPIPRSQYTYRGLELAKDMDIQEYAVWNTRWHEENQDMRDLNKVTALLAKLKSLRRIDVSGKAAPFTTEILLEAWMTGSGRENFRRASKEFLALPLEHLTTLRLTIDAHSFPHPRCWSGFGKFLCSIPSLKSLRFGFAPFGGYAWDSGMWEYADDNLAQWYIPLWRMLGEFTWKNLSRLRLDGLMVCEIGLSELLTRHAATLQYLDLFNLALWSGSFQGLLSTLRSELELKKFRLWGVVRGFHTSSDDWRLQPTLNLDDEVWSTQLKDQRRLESLSSPDISRRLDVFMTLNLSCSWPLSASDALDRLICPPRLGGHHSDHYQQDCVHSIIEINQTWDERVQKPLGGWVDNNTPDTQGIGEEKIIRVYDENDFDEGGFDKNGFNIDGEYFMDIYEDWQGAKSPISRYASMRIMRDGILSQISRYS
ncbi:hypothetical protein N431DRAFT_508294 [Stipitochalara longipes BDJ]|nr:hypothetical protein N431DRAFT_508294 [Stipitochalara longipes BDJ]